MISVQGKFLCNNITEGFTFFRYNRDTKFERGTKHWQKEWQVSIKIGSVHKKRCVACGVCENTCPLAAVKVYHGCYAVVEETVCVGCGKCAKSCPAGCIEMKERTAM